MIFDKNIDMRLATAEGHIKAIRQMIADNKDCNSIIMQLSAVEAMINSTAKIMIKNHLNHCVKEGIENGDGEILLEFNKVLDKYLK